MKDWHSTFGRMSSFSAVDHTKNSYVLGRNHCASCSVPILTGLMQICDRGPHLQDVVARVEGQLGVQHSRADAKGLQEEAQAEALGDGVDEQQHLLAH